MRHPAASCIVGGIELRMTLAVRRESASRSERLTVSSQPELILYH
jgi:hypothetical protein